MPFGMTVQFLVDMKCKMVRNLNKIFRAEPFGASGFVEPIKTCAHLCCVMAASVDSCATKGLAPGQLFTDEDKELLKDYGNGDVLPGSQVSESVSFKTRSGAEVRVTPVMVEFNGLLQSGDSVNVVPEVSRVHLHTLDLKRRIFERTERATKQDKE